MGSTKWDHRLKTMCLSIVGDLGEEEIYDFYHGDPAGFKDTLCKKETDSCKHSRETTAEVIKEMEDQAKVEAAAAAAEKTKKKKKKTTTKKKTKKKTKVKKKVKKKKKKVKKTKKDRGEKPEL